MSFNPNVRLYYEKHMAYAITFKENEGSVVTTYSGTVTDDELIKSANERLLLIEKIKPVKYFFRILLMLMILKEHRPELKESPLLQLAHQK